MLTHPERLELSEKMKLNFNMNGLRELCLHLEISFDDISGSSLMIKVISLIEYCEHRGMENRLLQTCHQLRPHIDWPRHPVVGGANDDKPDDSFSIPSSTALSFPQKSELMQALAACPSMKERSHRDVIVRNLPASITAGMRRDDAPMVDIDHILEACLNHEGGLQNLIEILRTYEQGSIPMRKVEEVLRSLFG